jgi:hypothetical protein
MALSPAGRNLNKIPPMKKLLVTSALLLLSPVPALASNWIQVFANPAEAVSVDVDSISRNGGNVKAWTQTVLTAETDVQLERPAKAIKTQYVADCQGRTLLVNALIFYDMQGSVLASLPPEQDSPAVVVPGTGGEFILRAVCNKG